MYLVREYVEAGGLASYGPNSMFAAPTMGAYVTSPFETDTLGLRGAENGDDGCHCVHHHQAADIDICILNAVNAQDLTCNNRDQPAAVNLRDLVSGTRARGAIASREVLRVEGRDGAITKTENEAETYNLGDCRQNEAACVD